MTPPNRGRGAGDRPPIDFVALADALLSNSKTLLPQWFPDGKFVGDNYMCGGYGGGPGRSLGINWRTGAWGEFSTGERGGDLISLYAAKHNLNNGQVAVRLMADLGWDRRGTTSTPPRSKPTGDPRPEPPPAEPPARSRQRSEAKWRTVLPVPASAPEPTFKHYHRRPEDLQATWAYRRDGALLGFVVRFVTSDGGKETLPHTWCVDESDGRGTSRWVWRQFDEPRPLFLSAGLLSEDGRLPVVLVEGEKCAQAGHELIGHEFDFVTWPGGSKAWARADWSWLAGRVVYMWPDCDAKRFPLTQQEREAGIDPDTKELKPEPKQPGMAAMVGIGSRLVADHGCQVHMCHIPKPGDVSDGWDIADAIAQGWTAETVRAFIRGASVFVPPPDAVRAKGASTPSKADAGEGGDGDAPSSKAWIAHLLRSATTGAVKAVRENVAMALDGWPEKGVKGIADCEGLVRFNEFTNNIEKSGPTPWGTPAGDWLEADELVMGDWLVRECGMPSMARQALEEAVVIVARRHSFHPLRDRIEGLRGRWDKTPRLNTWLMRCCLIEDEWDPRDPLYAYLRRVSAWFLMGAVARVMSVRWERGHQVAGPGVKFDYMLVFEGPTGWGKSTTAAILGGDYFADTGLDVTHKDSLMNIQGIWFYEWSELDQLAKQEIGAVKRFISSPNDRFRATFDRRPAKYPRQVVFVGTTEEATYLLDNKGNRRFWPVRVTRPPDTDWLRENLEQLLAEAVARVDALERFWPDRMEQRDLFDPQQMARTVDSSLDSAIRRFLYEGIPRRLVGEEQGDTLESITMVELLSAIGYALEKQSDAVVRRAGSVLHVMGWEIRRDSRPGADGRRPRRYVRPREQPIDTAAERRPDNTPAGEDHGEGSDDAIPF